jgi:hypothetical protein
MLQARPCRNGGAPVARWAGDGVIDYRESFWSLPESEWSRLYVRVRLRDFPDPLQEIVDGDGHEEVWRVDELVAVAPEAEFGYRSQQLFRDRGGRKGRIFSPLLLDIDLQRGHRRDLDFLRDSALAIAARRCWGYRLYSSGTGYHLEIDPATLVGRKWAKCRRDPGELRRRIRCEVKDGHSRTMPMIDHVGDPPKLFRMVGAKNRTSGTHKRLVQEWRPRRDG